MTTHLDGFDETLGSIDFLLDIEQRLLRLTAQMILILLILLHGIHKRLRHFQLWHFAIIECEGDCAIV